MKYIKFKELWIIIIIALLLVAVILVLGDQSFKATEKATLNEFNQRQLVLAKEATGGIEVYFEHLAGHMKSLARVPEIQHLDEAPTRREIQYLFYELEAWGVNDIGVLDANGVLKYNVMAHQIEGVDFSWRRYYQEAKEMTSSHTYVVEFIEFKGVEAGQKGVLVAVPMFKITTDENSSSPVSTFAGVVACTLKLDTVTQKFVAPVKSSEKGHAFLIDDEYEVLWAADRSVFGKYFLEEDQGFPALQQIMEAMRTGNAGTAEYSYYKFDDSTGKYTKDIEEKLIAYAPIRIGKELWSIGVWAPKKDAQKLIRSAYFTHLSLLGLIIMVILVGSSWVLVLSFRVNKLLEKEVKIKTKEVKKSEEQHRILVENISECIAHIDLDGNLLYMNPIGVKLNELESFEEMHGLGWDSSAKEEYKGLIQNALEKARRGEIVSVEYESITARGKHKWWEATIGPFKDETGKVVSLISICKDITEQKWEEEERERLIEELQKARARIKTLSGFLPVCPSCKKRRTDQEYWDQIEAYIRDHSEAEFSHNLCPDCAKKRYPEFHRSDGNLHNQPKILSKEEEKL